MSVHQIQTLNVILKGERGPGRRRISWLENLRTWLSKTTNQKAV
jgi:hypothetical protein